MKKVKIEIITKVDNGFRKEWLELWKKAWNANLYNSPEWFFVIRDAFNIKDYLIFVCYKDNKLFAVFPLVNSKKFGINTLTNPGNEYSDKSPILIYRKDISVLKNFFKKITNFGNIYFSEVEDWVVDIIKNIKSDVYVNSPEICPFIPNQPSFLSFLSKRQRKKIRNVNRIYAEKLKYETYNNDKEKIVNIVFQIENKSARRLAGKGTFTDVNSKKIFIETVNHYKDKIYLDVVLYDNKPIAYFFGIQDSKTYYAINTAYLEEYKELVPGKMVLSYLLERLQTAEVDIFDFLRGTNRLKLDFTPYFVVQSSIYSSKKIFINLWWLIVNKFSNFLKDNQVLYNLYLGYKKRLTN